jgi:gliding motility-associated-like protein
MIKYLAGALFCALINLIGYSRSTENIFTGPTDSTDYTGPNAICQGSAVALTAKYAQGGSTYQWQVSTDGGNNWNNVGTNSPNFSATTTGTYHVLVTTAGTTVTWPSVDVTVNPNPVADFSFSPNNACGSSPVSFTNASTGSGLTYTWSFNDPNAGVDSTSASTNPTHHFIGSAANGTQTFNVKLTVTNSFSCTNIVTKPVTTKSPQTILTGPQTSNYNGVTYFTQCSPLTTANFQFYNTSTDISTSNSFKIIWGDGSPDYTSTSFPTSAPQSHTYGIGTFDLLFIVSSNTGCVDTGYYHVFVGSNPAVGLGNPGNTTICAGTSLTFPISGTASNPPGTVYSVIFNDGTPAINFNHPAPADITHLFDKGSCGTNSPGYANSFSATIFASNPCLTSSVSVVPIYVSSKPKMDFGITPSDVICVNTTITATNTSGNISDVINGSCSNGKSVWSISPATGWTITSGSLGTDNGVSNINVWTAGSNSIGINFTSPGTYTIKLKGGNQNCGTDETTRTVCVNAAPVANFNLSAPGGCAPLNVTTTNTSNTPTCGSNTYQWSVSYSNALGCIPNSSAYSFVNGTSATSAQPEFQFTNPGVYTITLVTKNSGGLCTATVSKTVTVKAKPTATINAPNAVCQNGTITPTASVNNCYSSTTETYLWSFPGGSPSSSTSANPGPITYATSGPHTITLTVNNECGSTVVNKNINVNPAPDVTVPSNKIYCAGNATGGFIFTSSVNGATYTWTNSNNTIGLASSGSGNIANFTVTNSTTSPIVSTVTVTPTSGCSGTPQSFTIAVNPRPAPPTVSGPFIYCLNETATPLPGSGAVGNIITWYPNSSLTGGVTTSPTPNTSVSGTTTYYVTQTNSYECESAAATINVTVVPKITGNTIGSNQTICTNSTANTLTPQTIIGGGNGSFSYGWQKSTDGGTTWTTIPSIITSTYSPGVLGTTTLFRRYVNSSNCSDTSNVVTITVQGTLTNIDIAISQTICSGGTPSLLTGESPTGGNGSFTYVWESSTNQTTWNPIPSSDVRDYQPPPLTTTTYYRRKTSSGSCSGYSSIVEITVNPIPSISPITNKIYCNESTVNNISFVTTPSSNITYTWTNDNTSVGLGASGTGTPSFNAVNTTKIPIAATISLTPTYINNSVGCTGSAISFTISVLPTISLSPITDVEVCTGVSIPSFIPAHDAAAFNGSSVTYSWTVTGSGISLTSGSGPTIPAINTNNPGITDLVATVTITPVYNYGATSCNGTSTSYKITTKPGTPKSNAGADAELCAATSYTMQANQPSNANGTWSQYGVNTATVTTPTSATTGITDLVPGNTYYLVWTLSGFASCPDSKDTVVIKVDNDLVNTINTTLQTICAGQPVTINGDAPTGGNGTYQYTWQQSTDNVSWTTIPGQALSSLTFSPTQTVYVKRTVKSLPCQNESTSVLITVQPALTNNSISSNHSICINTPANPIIGSTPSGGNGLFKYKWQSSTDGGIIWNDIPSSDIKDYDPGVLTATTKYRRLVNTDLCSGPQASMSNVVTVTVNPDAKAVFNPTTAIGCVPFALTPSIINLQSYPANNSNYVWYVDNVLLGSGSTFPGYTMNSADDTITIKLVAVSAFGCKNDSVSHQFITHQVPQPAFDLSETDACGPVNVLITNTTPNIASFSYQWDFGNGQTSNGAQPGTIIFLPNPNFRDTTYKVTLSVASACQTIPLTKTVRVRSKPKALFTPNKSVGCSPMTVTFNNTSLGLNNSYVWDFDDGSATITTSTTGTIQHTFTTGVQDTFYVRLVAMNECGSDTLKYAIVVSPNQIHLDFAINGNEFSGCSPHTVKFINNTSGASAFTWNFGDGNTLSTTKNIDTVNHTYLIPGTYNIVLKATNGCSDTTSIETVTVYPKPAASYVASNYTSCIGDAVNFNNKSTGANSYLWQFGDGNTSTLNNPTHTYTTPGIYDVKLIVYSLNISGIVCTDSITQQVNVVSSMRGSFLATDTVSNCSPFTATFTNQNIPSVTTAWDFGDGTTGSGDVISHTFTKAGTYNVTLTTRVRGGCTYITTKTIKVLGPSGTWNHTTGYLCNNATANFNVLASNTDSYTFDFGDGVVLTSNANSLFHSYANGGIYYPTVTLKNDAGCAIVLKALDSIRVDKIKAGFTATQQNLCGSTVVNFTDTSHAFFGKKNVLWNFGDGTTSTSFNNTHVYTSSGIYPVQLIVFGNSGCSDTITKQISVKVFSVPKATILTSATGCERIPVTFNISIQSNDAINITQWSLSNGVTDNHALFNYTFPQIGNYTIQLIVGTVNGCYDTVTKPIQVHPTPTVTASKDITLCRGSSAPLAASGVGVSQWSWQPLSGLSCYNCTNPVASPTITTPYVIQASNAFGCSAYDTVVVTVIQPLQMKVSPSDSICIGESTNLLASGASSYLWSPANGLNNKTISNPTASPTVTTVYRVVGYDGFNCFTDTAFITVGVGQYPTVSLGPDQTLPTGTKFPLTSVVQNGPIAKWLWSPSTDLSCATCPLPVAEVKKDISYLVKVTTAYDCSATDTINIKAFCQSAQVYIPNAFTPNGDGYNDILMVRASGVALVKSFRIFNRWGEVVFEKGNFQPNDLRYGWDGRIKGIVGGPDVFVYTAEVVCENGTSYTYKGNVSILK